MISKPEARGGRRYAPYVFTQEGVAMLSSVLRSDQAIQVNIEIMRAFVRLRAMLVSHADLASRLDALEARYDEQFKVVFEAIRERMEPPARERRPIGFGLGESPGSPHPSGLGGLGLESRIPPAPWPVRGPS